ncbi:lipoprotein N-acyltransferase Lnb domain-containing protein [Frateuria aurantia]
MIIDAWRARLRLGRWLPALLCLLLAAIEPAFAGILDAPPEALQVSLITYGPGETYWERFGHDAIELKDSISGQAITFNYGVFDFDEKGFLLNFARGRMRYMMDAEPSADDNQGYIDAGRSVTRQVLDLDPAQADKLRQFLLWNLQPENLRYRYDYFQSNCATRVRDALDLALGGRLAAVLKTRPGGYSYRQQTDRLMAAQPWLMLLLDLGLGPFADRPLNAWQASFLPEVLSAQLDSTTLRDGRPLVLRREIIAPARLQPPPSRPPRLLWPMLGAGLGYALLLWLCAARWRAGLLMLGSLWVLAAGTAGLILAALWALTAHYAAWYNANLLLFLPLSWLWLLPLWRRRAMKSHLLRWLSLLQGAALLIALGLAASGLSSQHDAGWLGLAIPVWASLMWLLRHPRTD